MSDSHIKKKSYASIYDLDFDYSNPFTRLQVNSVLTAIDTNSAVLDVGTADGRFLKYLSPKIKIGVGIDLDKRMIQKALAVNASQRNLTFVLGDCLDLPFENDSFDVSYCFALLVICGNMELAISELSRVTKKFGTIILDLPNRRSISFLKWRKFYRNSDLSFSALTLKKSFDMLNELQLEVVQVHSQGLLKQFIYLPYLSRISKIFDNSYIARFDIWLSSKFFFKYFSARWIIICKVTT